MPTDSSPWPPTSSEVADFLTNARRNRLEGYRLNPRDIEEHANIEARVREGGYRDRHVFELIQNAADAAKEAGGEGRVELRLTARHLYVANDGAPLRLRGIETLLASHISDKVGDEIGRFGLGFKSVLGISDRIEVLSRSGSLRFDAGLATSALRDALPGLEGAHVPVLRLAWPVDPSAVFDADGVVRSLTWATTIVRVTLRGPDERERVAREIERFPPEFLLFVGVPLTLELNDGSRGSRALTATRDGVDTLLRVASQDGVDAGRWRVFTRTVSLTGREALADAGRLHARDTIPVAWAVPTDAGRVETGEFWAFFPLQERSRLPGIVNAPWKTNDDRTNLLPGAYNDELTAAVASLVVDSLPTLQVGADPGALLDLLPRRDGGNEHAERLATEVWARVAGLPIAPNGDGELRPADTLADHPVNAHGLVADWLELAPSGMRAGFVHDSALRGKRAGRWHTLVERQSSTPPPTPPLAAWLELVADAAPDHARRLIALIAAIHERDGRAETVQALRAARVLPATDGTLIAANGAYVAGDSAAGVVGLAPTLLEDEGTRTVLADVLKVGAFGDSQWRALLRERFKAVYFANMGHYTGARTPSPSEEQGLWALLAAAPVHVARNFLAEADVQVRIRVECEDRLWRPAHELLLCGPVVPADEATLTRNAPLVVAPRFERTHGALLGALHLADTPNRTVSSGQLKIDPLFRSLTQAIEDTFHQSCVDNGLGSPHRSNLRFLSPDAVPAPLSLLQSGEPGARARLTALLLDGNAFEPALFGHASQGHRYAPIEVFHPLAGSVWAHGLMPLDGELFAAGAVASLPESMLDLPPEAPDLIRRVSNLKAGFPDGSLPHAPPPAPLLRRLWRLAEAEDLPDELRQELLGLCAHGGWLPQTIRLLEQERALSTIWATDQERMYEAARESGIAVVRVDAKALEVLRKAGVKALSDSVRLVIDGRPPIPFEAAFPGMVDLVRPEYHGRIDVVFGANLAIQAAGAIREPLVVGREGTRLFIDEERFEGLPQAAADELVWRRMAEGGWLAVQVHDLVAQRHAAKRRAFLDQLEAATDLVARVLCIVGDARHLLARIPADLVPLCPEGTAAERIAELFLSVHGSDALRVLSPEVEAHGITAPVRWGTDDARRFAALLGFPPEFGGRASGRRAPEVLVPGPVRLGPLHDYQRSIVADMTRLLASGDRRRRAIVSLPTGAGKTRVAVEAVIASIRSSSRGPVLWVAQSDELCEQAVQCFRQVWSAHGSEDETLKISRLWGGNSAEVSLYTSGPHVVVATIQTLSSRMDRRSLAWLSSPGIVVIDEAHHAISPTYTGVLSWIESAGGVDPCPVIGLTATPFKGFDDAETARLARRFDQRLLPNAEEQPHLHTRLQEQGILARVDHEILDPPGSFDFSPEEIREIEMFGGQHFPETAARRLSEDRRRNEHIVERVLASPATERILLFAGSPDHARLLAALLTLQGRSAAAVVSETGGGARQHFIAEFKAGRIPVLTNYGVLTTGFDAPKVDTLLIARPTFSPVLYQQMIGRGLRGPENGGKPRCRLITVRDNLSRFGERLAFHHFLPLFHTT